MMIKRLKIGTNNGRCWLLKWGTPSYHPSHFWLFLQGNEWWKRLHVWETPKWFQKISGKNQICSTPGPKIKHALVFNLRLSYREHLCQSRIKTPQFHRQESCRYMAIKWHTPANETALGAINPGLTTNNIGYILFCNGTLQYFFPVGKKTPLVQLFRDEMLRTCDSKRILWIIRQKSKPCEAILFGYATQPSEPYNTKIAILTSICLRTPHQKKVLQSIP